MSDWSSPETADLTLDYLRERADPTGQASVSLREIGDAVNVGLNTAARAVKRLVRDGRVAVLRRGTGHRYPSRYQLVDVHVEDAVA